MVRATAYQEKIDYIICFKIKNPLTLHSTSKIQPTTSPTFVFNVSPRVGKSGVMKENNCWQSFWSEFIVFYLFSFYFSLETCDMIAYHLFVHNNYFVLCVT
jgi:hypothetical protein